MASIGDTTRPEYIYDQATDTWIPVGIGPHAHTPAAIGAIASSIVTAKGDIVTGTGSGLVSVTAVGNNGETLVADSSTATGLRYQVAKPLNAIYNSAMDIWQRGTSAIGTAYNYAADRFLVFRGAFAAGATFSRVASTQAGFQYAMKVQRDSGNTSTASIYVRQALETTDSVRFAGQTVTLSFYAKAGANYSSTSGFLVSNIYAGEGTNQAASEMTIWTTVTTSAQNNILTTSWQRFTQTVSISSTKTQFGLEFVFIPVGTAGADDSYQITGVQVEVGSVATGFQRQTGTIQGELAACQRYYWRGSGTQGVNAVLGSAQASSTTAARGYITFPVTMRTAPTAVDWSSLSLNEINAGYTIGAVTLVGSGVENVNTGAIAITTTGLNQYRYYVILINNSSSGYLGFSAEL